MLHENLQEKLNDIRIEAINAIIDSFSAKKIHSINLNTPILYNYIVIRVVDVQSKNIQIDNGSGSAQYISFEDVTTDALLTILKVFEIGEYKIEESW